ncbi:hypothetical protein KEJ17_00360 [Candidatus Bathyarchaeota archaeon]|nr:hypothetical protein [Candidatus Bathyarchaeota archaeon]
MQLRYAWIEWFLPFEILNLIVGLISYYFIAATFGFSSPYLQPYGGNFVAYLILGMGLNGFLTVSLNGLYNVMAEIYSSYFWSGGQRLTVLDYLSLANIPTSIWILSELFWRYFQMGINFAVYLIAGTLLLKVPINIINYTGAIVSMLLGILATIGIGFISASMVYLIDAWHGQEPIQWTINLLAGIVSGVYFPPEILPEWLRAISYYLPQTYTLKAARLAILQGYDLQLLLPDITILAIFALFFPIGIMVFKWSGEFAKRKISTM